MKKIKKYYFNLIILCLGIIFGFIFIYFINDLDKLIIKTEITEYLNMINKNKINIFDGLFNSFIENFLIYFIIWSSGFLFIFLPITYFIIFYKGFILGFLFSSLLYIYKIKGMFIFLVFVFPSELLSITFIIILSFIIFKFSKKFIFILINKDNYDLKKLIFKYFKLLILIFLIAIFIAITEVFINYYLVKILL